MKHWWFVTHVKPKPRFKESRFHTIHTEHVWWVCPSPCFCPYFGVNRHHHHHSAIWVILLCWHTVKPIVLFTHRRRWCFPMGQVANIHYHCIWWGSNGCFECFFLFVFLSPISDRFQSDHIHSLSGLCGAFFYFLFLLVRLYSWFSKWCVTLQMMTSFMSCWYSVYASASSQSCFHHHWPSVSVLFWADYVSMWFEITSYSFPYETAVS